MSLPSRLPPQPGVVGARGPGWLHERLRPVVVAFAPSTRTRPDVLFGVALVIASLLGARALGLSGVSLAGGAVLLVPLLGPRMVAHRNRATDRQLLPDRCSAIARSVRSGRPILDAVDLAFADDLPMARRWQGAVVQTRLGRPFEDALRSLSETGDDSERLLIAGLRIGIREGGGVAAATSTLAQRLRQEGELSDRRRVLTTQARTSAQVLAVLPVVFALTMAAVREPDAWTQPLGLVSLTVGLGLNGVGILWMRRLLRRLH